MTRFDKFFSIIVVIFFIAALINNPSKSDYISWLKNNESQKSNNNILVSLGMNIFEKQIADASVCKNYLIFSHCETKIMQGKTISATGFMNKFYSK